MSKEQKNFWVINQLENNTAEILLYGYIGDYDVSANDFVREFKSLEKDNQQINIRINSGGGSVFDGFAIFNAIKNSGCKTVGYIDGLAASMGTIVALACNELYMSKYAMFMTHKPSGFVTGNANDMKQNATMLEGLEQTLAGIYASKTGLAVDEVKKRYLNDSDNWFDATAALNEKLINGIYDGEQVALPQSNGDEKAMWNAYNNKFQNAFNNHLNMNEIKLTSEQLSKLNLKADAPPIEITGAIDNMIASFATMKTELETAKQDKQNAEKKLADLQKQQNAEKVTALLEAALNVDKKITKAQQTVLAKQYEGKPVELKEFLDATPKIVSITEQLNEGDELPKEFKDKTWDALDKEGKLPELKEKYPDIYKAMFKKEFGKEPND